MSMSRDVWETILFFSSIAFMLSSGLLVFAVGASVALLDYHPFLYAVSLWFFVLVIEFIAAAKSE